MKIDHALTPAALSPRLDRLWRLSASKIRAIERNHPPGRDTLVYTVDGRYTSRGWTEWTLGFRYGSALLQFDATGDKRFLEIGRRGTLEAMGAHLTDMGVHDHGFTIVSTYGNLLRLMLEGRIPRNEWERRCYETALRCSAAVQAHRWTALGEREGFIHSFNGPHSLFVDTMRTLRALAVGHRLGQVLLEEGGARVSLLDAPRAPRCARRPPGSCRTAAGATSSTSRGRVTHEAIFNTRTGAFRCLSSQQGYSPFTTWTRGLAWAMSVSPSSSSSWRPFPPRELAGEGGKAAVEAFMRRAACDACDRYLEDAAADGMPYWDSGAPGLPQPRRLPREAGRSLQRVRARGQFGGGDRGAGAAAPGALPASPRRHPRRAATGRRASRWCARSPASRTCPTAPRHEGLLLHSVYHRPNGWDAVPPGRRVPCGESSMWGDYHLREAALYLQRVIRREPYLDFWGPA